MARGNLTAGVITCPGRLGDFEYRALQIDIEGFNSPYVLTLALPAVGCHALSEQIDPAELYDTLARAINAAGARVGLAEGVDPGKPKIASATG
jgi:hypothetical protein